MNKLTIFKLTIFILILLFARLTFAETDNSTQTWLKTDIKAPITENTEVVLAQEAHIAKDGYYHYDIGVNYSFNNWKVGLALREAFARGQREDRPLINLAYKKKLDLFSIKNRLRAEYRIREDRDDIIRYRNKLSLKSTKNWNGFTPYIADEVFIDDIDKEFNQNRVFVGAEYKFTNKSNCQVEYIWIATDKGNETIDVNVISINWSLKI